MHTVVCEILCQMILNSSYEIRMKKFGAGNSGCLNNNKFSVSLPQSSSHFLTQGTKEVSLGESMTVTAFSRGKFR
jgi:hypothetical protein